MKTAKEYFDSQYDEIVCKNYKRGNLAYFWGQDNIEKMMKEFAKIHVKEALYQASQQSYCEIDYYDELNNDPIYIVNEQSILNCYPDKLII